MSDLVSSAEMNVLLAANGPATSSAYDFRRPDRVSKEQLRSLHLLHDRFALNVSTSMSAFLRAMTEVTIVSVDQCAYSEFLASLPEVTAFYAVSMQPVETLGALEINPAVAFSMVDRMLGGSGESIAPDRPLTEIEQNIVDTVVKLLLDHLSEAWRPATTVRFKIHGRETRPQMLQVTAPNEIVLLLTFAIRVGETRGTLNLSLPAVAMETVGESFAQAWQRTRRQPTADESQRLAENLGRVPLAVTALLSSTLSARELVELRAGDIVSLGRHVGQPVSVHVGDTPAYIGQLTQRNGSLAVTIQAPAVDSEDGGAA